jgi:hypothetical protein
MAERFARLDDDVDVMFQVVGKGEGSPIQTPSKHAFWP